MAVGGVAEVEAVVAVELVVVEEEEVAGVEVEGGVVVVVGGSLRLVSGAGSASFHSPGTPLSR